MKADSIKFHLSSFGQIKLDTIWRWPWRFLKQLGSCQSLGERIGKTDEAVGNKSGMVDSGKS